MKNIKKVLSLALALVMVVGALVVLPTEVKAEDKTTSVWSGEHTINSWDSDLIIDASKFASIEAEETVRLVVTYTAVTPDAYYSSMQI